MERSRMTDRSRRLTCPVCQEKLWIQDKFCPNCGTRIPDTPPPVAETRSAPDNQTAPEAAEADRQDRGPRFLKRSWRNEFH